MKQILLLACMTLASIVGLAQRPNSGNRYNSSLFNPDDTTKIVLEPGAFSGTDADGSVVSLRILSFPSNTNSMQIGTTTYTPGSFPSSGVTVTTNTSGQPTSPIALDPVSGTVTVVIRYAVIDNARLEDLTPGSATISFFNTITCTEGTLYAVNNSAVSPDAAGLRRLIRVNASTGATTTVADLFGGTLPASGDHGSDQTSAIALDRYTNTIWYSTRGSDDGIPVIFSYNLNTGNYGGGIAFPVSGLHNFNKAAVNPQDHKVYFHCADLTGTISNTLWVYNPATPNIAPVNLGNLSVSGFSGADPFAGGDIAFDALGNLTGAFSSANILAIFPASYSGDLFGGISLTGEKIVTVSTPGISAVALLTDGNYFVGTTGGTGSFLKINTSTGVQTTVSSGVVATDLTSCAAPGPDISTTMSAAYYCNTSTTRIVYTIKVKNSGQFHAIGAKLADTLATALSLVSVRLNGSTVAGVSKATLSAGIPIRSSAATTAGQLLKGDSVTITIECSATGTAATYHNQAFTWYNGIESLDLSGNRIPSDNPATGDANDATSITTQGCLTISGHIFNDANGMKDHTVNRTGSLALPAGLRVNLYDTAGKVVATSSVSSGTYRFTGTSNGKYQLQLNTVAGTVGNDTPVTSLPTGWVSTGEHLGTEAGADGLANGKLSLGMITADITEGNFGINRLPDASHITASISSPAKGDKITLNGTGGNPPVPVGNDPEDGALGAGKTIVIDSLPANASLLYHDTVVSLGQHIPSFNPALLQLHFTAASAGAMGTSFHFSYHDAAGIKDPSPASYSLSWDAPLPVKLISFRVQPATAGAGLFWTTASEEDILRFEAEWSSDGRRYEQIGSRPAAGSKDLSQDYYMETAACYAGHNLYRLKIVAVDGTVTYSPVRSLNKQDGVQEPMIQVYPSPVTDLLYLNGLKEGAVLQLYNSAGQLVLEQAAKTVTVTLQLAGHTAGTYLLLIRDGREQRTVRIQKN